MYSNLQLVQRKLWEAHWGCYLGPFHNVQRIAVLYLGPLASRFLWLAGTKMTETIRFNIIKAKFCLFQFIKKIKFILIVQFKYFSTARTTPISSFITSENLHGLLNPKADFASYSLADLQILTIAYHLINVLIQYIYVLLHQLQKHELTSIFSSFCFCVWWLQ